jgi:hypothetical protein
MTTLLEQIDTATQQATELVEALNARIESLPDNPRIKRLGANCFTISNKDLGNNWTPAHHDFKQQYRLIVKALQQARTIDAIAVLQQIVAQGRVRDGNSKNHINLHPDVIVHLRTLL